MKKAYKSFAIVIFLLLAIFSYTGEEISYENQITSLKTEISQLQEQRDNLLVTLKKELEKSKSSTSPLFFALNPIFILFVSNFIKEPSLSSFLPFLPYLYIIFPWSSSRPNELATSLIVLESTIKQKKEKIKELKDRSINPFAPILKLGQKG